jgi:NAD(P)H-flavin reductase
VIKPQLNTAKVKDLEWLNYKTIRVTFEFNNSADFQFLPGQYINLKVAENTYRPYSLCSDPAINDSIDIIATVGHEGLGANYLKSLKIGQEVVFIGPSGRFFIENDLTGDLHFVATGTGICPYISMLCSLRSKEYQGQIRLYWGLRAEKDLFYTEVLDRFRVELKDFDYRIVFSQPENKQNNEGFLITHVDKLIPETPNPTSNYFVCGNPNMVDDLRALLTGKNVPASNINLEKYKVLGGIK